MTTSMLHDISKLQRMTVGELQTEWLKLYGEPSRSRNRDFLWRRLAWRVQELAHGGLSARAKGRLVELAPDGFIRGQTPTQANVAPLEAPTAEVETAPRRVRDLRLPIVGSVITKCYKGRELRVVVRDGGFEFEGTVFGSLSALAREITGSQHINGKLFFGLTDRSRRS